MNEQVFCEWLLDLNSLFRSKGKKIVLLVENCPGHKIDNIEHRLDYVRVVFLPPNTTSVIQPCDVGIIQAFKSSYRRMMLRKVIQLVDDPSMGKLDSMTLKHNINILHCLQFAKSAWESVTAGTIQNCWRKAGFKLPNSEAVDDPLDEAEEDEDNVDSSLSSDLTELEKLDETEPCCVAPSDDIVEIVDMLQRECEDEGGELKEEEGLEEATQPPTSAELLQAIATVRLALYASKADSSIHSSLSKVENYLSAKGASRMKQSRLDDMWQGK